MDASLRRKQKKGAYDGSVSAKKISTTLTDDLHTINNDKRLNLIYSERVLPPEEMDLTPSPEEQAADLADMKATNFGVERIERIPFNIGYLGLQQFAPAREAAQLEILKKMTAAEKDQARPARINMRIEKVGAESAAL